MPSQIVGMPSIGWIAPPPTMLMGPAPSQIVGASGFSAPRTPPCTKHSGARRPFGAKGQGQKGKLRPTPPTVPPPAPCEGAGDGGPPTKRLRPPPALLGNVEIAPELSEVEPEPSEVDPFSCFPVVPPQGTEDREGFVMVLREYIRANLTWNEIEHLGSRD